MTMHYPMIDSSAIFDAWRKPRPDGRHRDAQESHSREVAGQLYQLANLIEADWANAPAEARELLVALAYAEPKHFRRRARLSDFIARIRVSIDVFRDPEGVREFLTAADRVRDAVLTAIERESKEFEEGLARDLVAVSQADRRDVIEPGQEHDYLTRL